MTTQRATELSPQYQPAEIEREIYARWVEAGVFTVDASRVRPRTIGRGTDDAKVGRPPFVIVMPPPNVTAVLHVGHALNNTVQDVIIRWRRMSGDEALWLPGTDHAGIATQNVVEKELARDGMRRVDLGREAFVARVRAFVEETGGTILEQLKAIGASCDWTRTAYTLSPELSHAVREAFVTLFEEGLIYRGHRVIHWCPRCLTSLSDEEAEHAEESGTLYHIRYPLAGDPSGAQGMAGALTVATTRPETMLGDVAVAVNPDDERYRDLIGRRVRLPIAEMEIPIVADAYADPAFGTGVVKVTPAHDPNDFDVGVRHGLPMPVVMTPDAKMAEVTDADGRVPEALRGLDRFEARERIVEMLRDAGLLERTETHRHGVRHCYRCDTVVEPRLSDQWFVRMKPLAEPALDAVHSGSIRILPERWEAVYINWLENIRDWNISRQLWWGHRIPVWYCERCSSEPMASREDLTTCPRCGGPVRQDEDVLDTWFSSWLWPFSTLGWPDRNAGDLRAFYPTDMLFTAPEILFFWVARMIMAGYHFMGRAPFHTVSLHGTVRDANHMKMSKSLGNGIDPLDVVALYGADALRYTLIAGMGLGADLILETRDLEKAFAPGRNFTTKLWNIGRFLLANVGDDPVLAPDELVGAPLTRADQWILAKLDGAVRDCEAAVGPARPDAARLPGAEPRWAPEQHHAGLRMNEYAEAARRFVWNELADWYVEAVKSRLVAHGPDRETARAVLVHTFDAALRLLHPIIPFVTEALWQRLPNRRAGEWLATAAWPTLWHAPGAFASDPEFEMVRLAVTAIRQVRADYGLPPGKSIEAVIVPGDGVASTPRDARVIFEEEAPLIGRLSRANVTVVRSAPPEAAAHVVLPGGSEVIVPLAGVIDVARECERIKGELGELDGRIAGLERRLDNEGFLGRAPANVVEAERQKHRDWLARREQLSRKAQTLCGG